MCGACHPFYTGTQKLIDTAGRVDRFRKRYEKKGAMAAKAAEVKASEVKASEGEIAGRVRAAREAAQAHAPRTGSGRCHGRLGW